MSTPTTCISKPRQIATESDIYDQCDELDFNIFGTPAVSTVDAITAPVGTTAYNRQLKTAHQQITAARIALHGRSEA